ncbi:rho GTPase-activating protein 20 isoform X1 [Erpetoichthys calabaricus]|uniref:rho GTPase-activating protein 20 isoform X1 n=1 Tax=Erpetoichthys calabaricus TaxID=27687 RepID=UPI002234E7B7|nr:rho GTPase-activating protein 20 isoform X1 [Erpetoichthys calabaricus]
MTPQQSSSSSQPTGDTEELRSRIQQWEKKMKSTMQRRRSAPSAISKALGRSRVQSRDGPLLLPTTSAANSSLIRAFATQKSTFIMEEHVQLSAGLQTQERHLLLFSDVLVIAKLKSSLSLKVKHQVPLCDMWVASCVVDVADRQSSAENSFVIGWPINNYVVTLSSPSVKQKWLSALQWQISEIKREDYPRRVPMELLLLDIGKRTTQTMTLSVGNWDTAEKIIKLATQQIGVVIHPGEYHLWVISGKDDTPHLLLGHEYPFSIIMSCFRDLVEPSCGDPVQDWNLLLEQLTKSQQCRFILKPRSAARRRADSLQKQIKRKKSLIDWALRRGQSSASGSQMESPKSPRKLFGHSLSSICHNGNLPKPIMDMLYLLYNEGPSTRGIFRRSANAKTCKELKERLNSGDSVQVEGESVFVAAAIITDFLRNIPGSILSAELYEKWMETIEIEDQNEKLEAMKRLVEQLPEANVIFLRHLFGLLHLIEKNSVENQMTAFNLSLCIAPNMLWLPVTGGPEEESQSTRKVASLVQLLIENSPRIFGGDIASLFKKPLWDGQDADCVPHDQEKTKASVTSQRDSLFLPLGDSILGEEKEDWGLLEEMDAYKKKILNADGANSRDNLDDISFHSHDSLCSLSAAQGIQSARDRCSSEPSVCMDSKFLGRFHAPVARQSSCDGAMIRGHHEGFLPLHKLQLDERRPLVSNSSPTMSGRSQQGLWRSPQIVSRIRQLGSHRMTLSSFSSLSSTATTPSASSLSSLESSFSCCSDSVFGLADATAFAGPPWKEEMSSMVQMPADLDWHNEYSKIEQESIDHSKPEGLQLKEDDEQSPEKKCGEPGLEKPTKAAEPREEAGIESRTPHRETSFKHIQLVRPKTEGVGSETLKRTKITFYVSPNQTVARPFLEPVKSEKPTISVSVSNPVVSQQQPTPSVQLCIPQTVFYGQNAPLVLQSVSTRRNSMNTNMDGDVSNPTEASTEATLLARSASRASSTIRHTIRIILPASVRNTVKEYFQHSDPKSCHMEVKAVEKELVRSKAEWQVRKCPGGTGGTTDTSYGEESFV